MNNRYRFCAFFTDFPKTATRRAFRERFSEAFSLMEILIVIAVIGIMATLLLPYFSRVQSSAQESVARQQQSELQAALDNWIISASSQGGGLASARQTYANASVKLALLQDYLQANTYANLAGSGNDVTSEALIASRAKLRFSDWASGGSPSIMWINTP